MSAAAEKLPAPDPFATVRALNRMRAAGFALSVEDDKLMVEPLSRLSDSQRSYLRAHKAALVALLMDAETVHRALVRAGAAGLGWREGTPRDWADDRLLAAGEVLYGDGRMVNRNERRYGPTSVPAIVEVPEYRPPDEAPPASPAVDTSPLPPLVCAWNGLGRLVTKCSAPEPNADGTGCANCGASKPKVQP